MISEIELIIALRHFSLAFAFIHLKPLNILNETNDKSFTLNYIIWQ